MRKITENASNAFINEGNFSSGNTSVVTENNTTKLYLHGNCIAWKGMEGHEKVTKIGTCGWLTSTTKERLNGLPGVQINQVKGKWYLNGKQWSGKPIKL